METSVNSSGQIAGQGDDVRALQPHGREQIPAARVKASAVQVGDLHHAQPRKTPRAAPPLRTSTVLEDSVKFSNHAAPASTSAAGSSQRRQLFRPFFPMPAPPFSIVYHTRPAKKSRTVAPAGHFAPSWAKKTPPAGLYPTFCIVIFHP